MARGMRKSLVGQRFGKLKVVGYEGTDKFRNGLWLCECDCGNKIVEKGSLLTKGNSMQGRVISCGQCSNKYDKDLKPIEEKIDKSLVGKRFGKLVIKEVFMKNVGKQKRQKYAICQCDCGNETEVKVTFLKNGTTLSCGCLRDENMKKAKYQLTDDFVGQRFGKLEVIGYDNKKKRWQVKCDCGNIIYLLKSQLTVHNYRSCGHCNGKRTKNRRTREELENGKN